jgi:imidazolonepropionase-like amidohydrolase
VRAVAIVAAIVLLAIACATKPVPVAPVAAPPIALVGGRVQPSPGVAPIPEGVVVIEDGVISALGSRTDVRIPQGAKVLDCAGGTVAAGFWNIHVHFTQPVFASAATAPADQLTDALRAMLTSRGAVRVLDTGSQPANTQILRRRIESGEIAGPAILMASGSFVPEGGSPYYVLPARLPELKSASDAPGMVNAVLDGGAEGIKIFSGSWASQTSIVVMPIDVVRAVTQAAHRRGKFVIAHPSNGAGARVAIEGGVDILAHTFPTELDRRPWDRALPGMMVERRVALVPTLKLFPSELRKLGLPQAVSDAVLGIAQAQLRAFADAGGQVLFGTDVGYMPDYDTTDEYVFMQQAGLSYAQILAALTTAPAERFGVATRAGRLARGFAGDVVVVDGDPEADIRALAKVRYTVRGGRVLYARGG